MIKQIYVKHRHRYSLEEADLYKGEANFTIYDDYEELVYREADGVKVKVLISSSQLIIIRSGELQSNLTFKENQKTINLIKSPYGDIEIELFTYQYISEPGRIIVDYDILSSNEEKDGYHIEFSIEEGICEYN